MVCFNFRNFKLCQPFLEYF